MKRFLLFLPFLCFSMHLYAQDVDFGDVDLDDDDKPAPQHAAAPSTPVMTPQQIVLHSKKLALLQSTNKRLRDIEMTIDLPVTPSVQKRGDSKEMFLLKDNDRRLGDIEKVLNEPGTQLIRHNSLEENVRDVNRTIQNDDLMDTNSRPVYTN